MVKTVLSVDVLLQNCQKTSRCIKVKLGNNHNAITIHRTWLLCSFLYSLLFSSDTKSQTKDLRASFEA